MCVRFGEELLNATENFKEQTIQLHLDRLQRGSGKGLRLPPLYEEEIKKEFESCHSKTLLLQQEALAIPLLDDGARVLTRGLLLYARIKRLTDYLPSPETQSLLTRIRGLILSYTGLQIHASAQETLEYQRDSEDEDLDVVVLIPSDLELSEANLEEKGSPKDNDHQAEGTTESEVNRGEAYTTSEVNRETARTRGEVNRETGRTRSEVNRGRGYSVEIRCFKCGKSGHMKFNCTNQRQYSPFQSQKRYKRDKDREFESRDGTGRKGSHL